MKTSIYIKLLALIAILSLAVAKDTKAPKGTKSPKAGKVVTEEDFKNPDKIITVEAEPLPQGPVVWPLPLDEDEGPGRRLNGGLRPPPPPPPPPRPPVVIGPKIASITEFSKKDFLAAIAKEEFPTKPKAVGLVCACPPYAATFICIGFASCDGCCIRVSEILNPRV